MSQKNTGVWIYTFEHPNFHFNNRLKSQISVNENAIRYKKGVNLYITIYIIYILYIIVKVQFRPKISNLVTEIWDLRFWDASIIHHPSAFSFILHFILYFILYFILHFRFFLFCLFVVLAIIHQPSYISLLPSAIFPHLLPSGRPRGGSLLTSSTIPLNWGTGLMIMGVYWSFFTLKIWMLDHGELRTMCNTETSKSDQ